MHLFTVRNIPIRLHGSFLILGGVYLLFQALGSGLAAVPTALFLATILFGSVLLHELGHAMAGRVFGIHTRDITLYPFGGIASMEMPSALPPVVELIVAIAGPATNGLLALLGLGLLALGIPGAQGFIAINVGMAVFNMLPAFPMDGGRVLRAFWSLRKGLIPATLDALKLSRWIAWGMIAVGLFTSPSLLLVGGFLLLVNGSERQRLLATAPAYRGARVPRNEWEHPVV